MKKFELENCRTKEELKAYLAGKGLDASDEAIENLKKKYEQNLQNTNILTSQQLNNVAGGAIVLLAEDYEAHKNQTDLVGSAVKLGDKHCGTYFSGLKKVVTEDGHTFAAIVIPNGEKNLRVIPVDKSCDLNIMESIKNNMYADAQPGENLYALGANVAKQALSDTVTLDDGTKVTIFGTEGEIKSAEEQYISSLDLSGISHQEGELSPIAEIDPANIQNQSPDSCTLL